MTDSGALIEDSDAVSINFPDGPTYSPGAPQNLRLEIDDPAGVVFGFELSSRDPANEQAGNLASVDASTSVNTSSGIQYLGHSINPKAEGVFDFEWTPPPTDVGTITMYVAANAANGNHDNLLRSRKEFVGEVVKDNPPILKGVVLAIADKQRHVGIGFQREGYAGGILGNFQLI